MKKMLLVILCFAISGCNGLSLIAPTSTATSTSTATPTLTPTFTPTLTHTPSPSPTATPDPYGKARMIIFDKWVFTGRRYEARGVYLAGVDQEQPDLITETGYYLVDISPDLKKILISNGTSLVVFDYITQEKVILTPRLFDYYNMAYWSKNDNLIVYIAWDDAGLNQIYTVNPDGTNLKQITPIYSNKKPYRLFPYNGDRIFWEKGEVFPDHTLVLGDYYATKDATTIEEEYILDRYPSAVGPVNKDFKFSPSGSQVVVGERYGDSLYITSIDKDEKRIIFTRNFKDPSRRAPMEYYWSPASKYILIDDVENAQSYIYDVDNLSLIQLPREVDNQTCFFIGWSPDESKLLVRFSPSGSTALLDIKTLEFISLSIVMPFQEEEEYPRTQMAFLIP